MLTFIAEGGTGDTELIVVVCCGIGKRKHEALPGRDAILWGFGSLVFVFCGALTQLKQKNTKRYWAAEAKAADELGGDVQCCTAGLGWEGRQNRSFLSQSWVIHSSSLYCSCCLFQKALHSYFLLKMMVPAACLQPTAFSCFVTLIFLLLLLGESCMWYQILYSWILGDTASEMSVDRCASQTNHRSFMLLWKCTDALQIPWEELFPLTTA